MLKDTLYILASMLEDNNDTFACYEVIEPYVNANCETELSEHEIFRILGEMLAEGFIELYHYSYENDAFSRASGNITSHSWFAPTEKGGNAYKQSFKAGAKSFVPPK
jgi:hypothetical protein